ncbi:MAG: lipoprotein [Thermodesulfobacteriota bacterium]
MKKLIFIFSVVFMLTGCATTHMAKPDRAPELTFRPDRATLVIIRETFFGGAIVFWHYLDGKLIGETTGNTYFVTPVPPGPHYVVIATENTAVAHFDFKPGKTYFLGEGIAMGVWRARTSGFYPMTQEDAVKAMMNCSYLEYDPKTGQEPMDPQLYQQAIDEYLKEVKANPDGFKDILKYDGVEMK